MITKTVTFTEILASESQAKAQLESIIELVDNLHETIFGQKANDKKREDAEQRIHEDALSVEVRSGWYTMEQDSDKKPLEFRILLCTGGPAVQLIGELSEHGEPESVRIEHQDWGTPWTEYRMTKEQEEKVLSYCSCFYFGE